MNLTAGGTFPMALIKRAKTGVNKKIKFPPDTMRRIQESEIINGWNTQIVQILREVCDEILFSKEICSVDYQNMLN